MLLNFEILIALPPERRCPDQNDPLADVFHTSPEISLDSLMRRIWDRVPSVHRQRLGSCPWVAQWFTAAMIAPKIQAAFTR
jgi:hypothetical protein